MKNRFTLFAMLLISTGILAQSPVKVDFDKDERALDEVHEPGYESWVITNCVDTTKVINGIKITMANGKESDGASLKSHWHKVGIQAPYYARLVSDGLTVNGGDMYAEIDMTIEGLAPGSHSLLTYHNTLDSPDDKTFGMIDVFVNGELKVEGLMQSNRALSTYDAATAYVTFDVKENEPVVVTFRSNEDSPSDASWNIVINGFCLDVPDAGKQAKSPFPAAEYVTNAFSTDIKAEFKEDETEPRKVSVAGRMMSRRVMGKASFIELQDSKGRIQIYITRDDICPDENKDLYNIVFKRLLDLGDFIGIEGYVFKTQMGEISIHAKKLTVLSKSLKPLPIVKYKDGVAYDKFEDPELRYRQRYVDLIVNEGVKETFEKRAIVVKTLRAALDEAGYTEVETPILQSIPGGASARPFITHHNSLDMDLYLRIATELYLKRLIVGGFEGVYEIGKNFRNEGMDKNHNPEFTCMELYVQYKDYNWMMSFTEKLLERICIAVNGSTDSIIDGKTISFKAPYRRLPILEAIKEKTGYDLNDKTEEEIRQVCKELKMEEIDETMGKGKLIDEIFGEFCEDTYIQPTFITDYPVEMSPLTKMHRSKPGLTERFELMVNGKELANAYSELNDPIDQEERFKEQMKLADKGDDEAMIIDQDFLRALQYGMPPTSGIGIGIDRLVMLMTGKPYIQEVLFFPQMRPEKITPKDSAAKFMELGIAEEWVPAIQKAGYNLVSDMKDVNPQKLHQDICGINKKYKLELTNPTVDEVAGWISKI